MVKTTDKLFLDKESSIELKIKEWIYKYIKFDWLFLNKKKMPWQIVFIGLIVFICYMNQKTYKAYYQYVFRI